jgi:FKBP-type peptidyl-prolyl cis-trans isomerase (trigger factor)
MQKSNKTPEIVEKELKEEAEKRITLRFGVQKLIEDQKIELTPEEEKQAADERLAAIPEDQRSSAAAYFAKGGEGYEELVWGKKVEKLVKTMLA